MAKLDNIRRITIEDFPKEDRQTISRLAEILNPFMQQIIDSYDNKLDFNNLNQEIKDFKIQVDVNGQPINDASTVIKKQLKISKLDRIKGIYVINAKNQDNTSNYPTSGVFVDYSQDQNLLQINRVIGLQTGEEYRITIIIIYN